MYAEHGESLQKAMHSDSFVQLIVLSHYSEPQLGTRDT